MLLAIDVGNTNAKFAVFRDSMAVARWRIATDDRRTADEYMVWLDQLLRLEGLDRAEIDAVIISTVVPRALHNLTATTFDHIGPDGAYLGGIIAPGDNLSLEALVNAAAKLPRIAIEAPASNSVIGRTTESQMLIGVYWGYVGMIEGLMHRMKAEIGKPVTVIATGGLAILFQEQAHLFDRVEPDLTLNGLMHLYNQRGISA